MADPRMRARRGGRAAVARGVRGLRGEEGAAAKDRPTIECQRFCVVVLPRLDALVLDEHNYAPILWLVVSAGEEKCSVRNEADIHFAGSVLGLTPFLKRSVSTREYDLSVKNSVILQI